MSDELAGLLTEREAAEILNVAPGTLSMWRHLRKGPDYTLCNTLVRYAPEDLKRYLSQQSVVATDGPRPELPRRKAGPGRPRQTKTRVRPRARRKAA